MTTSSYFLTAFLFSQLVVLAVDGDDDPAAGWLRGNVVAQIAKFERVTFTRHPVDSGLIAANCESQIAWWSKIHVFHQSEGRLDWMAAFPKEYTEKRGNYVMACEWHYLANLDLWVLAIFDSTHMGNGSFWLFELKGQSLRCLMNTVARGHFLPADPPGFNPLTSEKRLIEDHLSLDFHPLPGSSDTAPEAIFLRGNIGTFEDQKPIASIPYEEVWVWDATQRVFTKRTPAAPGK